LGEEAKTKSVASGERSAGTLKQENERQCCTS